MQNNELIVMIDRYLEGTATDLEQELVANYYQSFQQENAWDEARFGSKAEAVASVIANVLEKIQEQPETSVVPMIRRVRFIRKTWVRYAAAIILIAAGLGTLFVLQPWKTIPAETAQVKLLNDIQPAAKKAYIILGDGSKVVLKDIKIGAKIGQATKTAEGELVYSNQSNQPITYNTVTVPRGGEPQHVELPDHTEVWLNTESSITYPTAFTGETRNVEMKGEAYFEVAKNGKSFTVQTHSDKIEVLGTHFNIRAYTDEPVVRTTLLEGRVKVGNTIIAPDEQYANGKVIKIDQPEIQRVMAWRNGLFSYNNVDVKILMRDVSRWYDVEVVFEGEPTMRRFEGEIGRSLTLKQLLTGLKFKDLNYRLEKGADGSNRIVMLP